MNPENWEKDITPIHLINPLKLPVEIEEFDDQNQKVKYTIPSMEIKTFPKYQADIIKKHLIDAIINTRKLGYLTPEKRQELEEEVVVNLG